MAFLNLDQRELNRASLQRHLRDAQTAVIRAGEHTPAIFRLVSQTTNR